MITVNRPVVRETAARVFSGGSFPVVLEIVPPGHVVRLRLKGRRQAYTLPVAWMYQEALRQEVLKQREEKKRKKKVA
jgi:hypothetical protein